MAGTVPPNPLPPPSITHHSLALPGRSLHFKATAEAVRLSDAQSGAPLADVATTAFESENQDATRPLTIVINGGPGASSAWLDLGGIGPWRLPTTPGAIAPSQSPAVVDNADTWLDFTDLLFVDPIDTGYSRLLGKSDSDAHRFFTVDGDISSLATVIRKWLVAHNRLTSPKYILGESYGGFRAPKLAKRLERNEGIGINGAILLSPVLDFDWFWSDSNPGVTAAHLPSLVAALRKIGGPDPRSQLVDAESYASGSYLVDLFRGVRDEAAVQRINTKIAALTGFDESFIRRFGGRPDISAMLREKTRQSGRIASSYDGTVTGLDAKPFSDIRHHEDPILDALKTPLAEAMAEITARRLNWPVQARYEILNLEVNSQWDWGEARHPPEAIDDLAALLSLDPTFKVIVMHGVSDLVTPYFVSKMLIDQVPTFGDPQRLRLAVYGGGHMPYLDPVARSAMRQDARALMSGDPSASGDADKRR